MVEFWLGTFPVPGRIAEIATMAEDDGWDGLAFTDSQNLGGDVFVASASQTQWLAGRQWRPPHMSVAATGPKVIRLAARLADGITFSVGADIVRLRTAIDLARRTRTAAGLPPLRLGAYINAVAHPDVGVARDLVRGRLGVYARFSTMDPSVLSALSEADRKVADELVNT